MYPFTDSILVLTGSIENEQQNVSDPVPGLYSNPNTKKNQPDENSDPFSADHGYFLLCLFIFQRPFLIALTVIILSILFW